MLDRLLRHGLVALTVSVLAGCCCPPRPCAERGATVAALPAEVDPAEPRQIFIDVTTVRIPEDQVAGVLGDLRPQGPNNPTLLSAAQSRSLQEIWRDNAAVHVLNAPKLLALEGQDATIEIGETIRFAKTVAETNEDGGLEFSIVEKDGEPVFVGYRLRVVATPSADGKTIHVDFHRFSRKSLDELNGATLAGLDPKQFLKDHVFEEKFDASFDVADGAFALIGTPAVLHDADGRHVRVTLIGPRILIVRSHAIISEAPLPPRP